jgi:hypothetical protein
MIFLSKSYVYNLKTASEFNLEDMPYAMGTRYNTDQGCLQGTRCGAIEAIHEWFNQKGNDPNRILLLADTAASGKLSIAHELAPQYDSMGFLRSSYFCDRAHLAEHSPKNLFSTIARYCQD